MALPRELKRQALRAMLRPGEDDRGLAIGAGEHAIQEIPLAPFRNRVESVLDSLDRCRVAEIHDVRLVEDPIGQLPDRLRHGRREEEILSILRQSPQDPLDVGQEAHVEHVIRLVEDQGLDLGEVEMALLKQVEHAPRAADHDLGTTAQGPDLRAGRHSAEDRDGPDVAEPREPPDLRVDLDRQLAGGRQDQDQRASARLFEQPLQDGQREGRRLAGPGLGQAHDVPSLETGRNRLDLDRPGFIEARGPDAAIEAGIEAEAVEAALRPCICTCTGQTSSPPCRRIEPMRHGCWF
jgi:hypothetical protein